MVPLLGGVRALAVDLRGHGLSAHRPSYRYADYEHDLLALIAELGYDRVPVAGHSLGGYVALLAAAASDRIGGVLAADVKSDWTDADDALAARSRHAEQRVEPERDALVVRLARSLGPVTLAAEELDLLAERSIEPVEGGWRLRWDRRVLATEPVAPFGFLSAVRCPVDVVAGSASDVMPPDRARAFAAALPDAALEVVEGAGHHLELEAPERLAARILALAGRGGS